MINNKLVLTLDTDCGNDEVIEDSINLIIKNGIDKFVVFATKKFSVFKSLPSSIEIGIHPYISCISEGERVISSLKKSIPSAISLRNHTLFNSAKLFRVYANLGIKATSNYLSFFSKNLSPISLPYEIKEYPIYFMDDAYILLYTGNDKFTVDSLNLNSAGLKVLAFHPIHIFLNTENLSRYEKAKSAFRNINELRNFINKKNKGIKDLFCDVLQYIKENKLRTYTFMELI